MAITFADRLMHAWNAFSNPELNNHTAGQYSSTTRLDKPTFRYTTDRTIIASIYNRIAIDCSEVRLQHVKANEDGQYISTVPSKLNRCLSVEANMDQTGRSFMHDLVQSLCDEGYVAVVPVETDLNPNNTASFDVTNMRVGKITQWYPDKVKVDLYNEKIGKHKEVVFPKKMVAIIENPHYAVMNQHNSTFKRLLRKLALLDIVDEQTSSGKLNMIIQLPYTIKSEARRAQAEQRTKDIEEQLSKGKYGIAYTDGTEKITQLSRPLENGLMAQIEYLMTLLYSQLGISKEVMDGTANEQQMINYYDRTIEPILNAIADEMKRKFLSKTAQTQGQTIMYFRDHFKLAQLAQITEAADKLTRNEIMTSNEFRSVLGLKPSQDPNADQLRNKNMPVADTGGTPPTDPNNPQDPSPTPQSADESSEPSQSPPVSLAEQSPQKSGDVPESLDNQAQHNSNALESLDNPAQQNSNVPESLGKQQEEAPQDLASTPIAWLMNDLEEDEDTE